MRHGEVHGGSQEGFLERGGLSSQVFPKEKELARGRREVVKTKAWVWDTTRKLHEA